MLLSGRAISQENHTWEWLNPLPQGNPLSSVYFLDKYEGWACGFGGTIMHTTDGGKTWDVRYGKYENRYYILRKIYFIDRKTGFCVGDGGIYEGIILKTTDGGKTWIEKKLSGCFNYNDIFFVDKNNGYLVGDLVLKTTDCGKTWVDITRVPRVEDEFFSVYFINKDEGWFGGGYGTIYHTTDGGETWEVQRKEEKVRDIRSLYFIDSQRGWATGENGLIIFTTDGGKNWNNYVILREKVDYDFIYFDEDNTGWLLSPRYLFKSTDGGIVWKGVDIPDSTDQLKDMAILDDGYAYAVGLNAAIIKTTDEGSSWKYVTSGTESGEDIVNIKFFDKNNWVRLNWNRKIQKTSDGGKNWTVISNNPFFSKNIIFYNKELFWATAYDGFRSRIYHSTDGGKSWVVQKKFENVVPKKILFINSKKGFIVGRYNYRMNFRGVIIRTIDGGKN